MMDKLIEKIERILWAGITVCIVILLFCDLFVWDHKPLRIVYEDVLYQEEETDETEVWDGTVTLTVYNPVPEQCDEDPLTTADNSQIDLGQLKKENIKWIAVSRDLLAYFSYGDKVKITCPGDPSLSGVYELHDTMHKRFKKCVDVLAHPDNRTTGKYKNVRIEPIEEL